MKNVLVLLSLILLIGCAQPETNTTDFLYFNTEQPSSLPHLTTGPNGTIYLSWVEEADEHKTSLNYAQLQGGKWSKSQTIATGDDWFVNWADFPSLMVNGDQMAAHWLEKSQEGTYDYDVKLSLSSNGGQNWKQPQIVHNDGVSAEHGFASMLPLENDQTFITWLDGRNTKKENGAMTLRAAIFDQEGNAINRWELDNRICDCCQTGAAMTENGPIVIYRDRSENEIRDMSIVRWVNGSWTPPTPISVELWEIAGCPVNGPQIVANGKQVVATWFTAAQGTAKVKIAFSQDAGATFGNPILVSEGSTLGRVGIASLPNGEVVISYMESRNQKAQIMLSHYSSSGDLLVKRQVAETSSARNSGFPVISTSGDQIIMAWTEAGEKSIVKTASINL